MKISYLGIVLQISGILVALFVRDYPGHPIPYSTAFRVVGIMTALVGFIVRIRGPFIDSHREEKVMEKAIIELKEYGEKILIKFAECEMKGTSDSIETRGAINSMARGANGGDSDVDNSLSEESFTVLVYKKVTNKTGMTEEFISQIIPADIILPIFETNRLGC